MLTGMLPAYSTMLMVQVDQLLEYHFEEDMARLTQHCGKRLNGGRQTIIVSATLTQEVGLCLFGHLPACLPVMHIFLCCVCLG